MFKIVVSDRTQIPKIIDNQCTFKPEAYALLPDMEEMKVVALNIYVFWVQTKHTFSREETDFWHLKEQRKSKVWTIYDCSRYYIKWNFESDGIYDKLRKTAIESKFATTVVPKTTRTGRNR